MWLQAALTFLVASTDLQAVPVVTESEAFTYLQQYGYTDNGEEGFASSISFSDALKKFQIFAGLPATGKLDKKTKKMMRKPRCGVDDRLSNFVLHGSKWSTRNLSYRVSKYPIDSDLSTEDVDSRVRKAFAMWEKSSGLTFRETNGDDGEADIEVSFQNGEHGDGNAFDGPRGVLAHAFFPLYGGDVHMDASEAWSVTPFKGQQLLGTLVHELGHSLGLRHSREAGSVMAPFYQGWRPKLSLGNDDIEAIQDLYGAPLVSTTPSSDVDGNPENGFSFPGATKPDLNFPGANSQRPVTEPVPTVTSRTEPGIIIGPTFPSSKEPDICESTKIDAIVKTSDGKSYVFRNSYYWLLSSDSIAPGYPRKISEDWPGLPDNVDAAFTWRETGFTYFFKDGLFWRFSDKTPSSGYPKSISNWPGLPLGIQAAFQFEDRNIYFFKGNNYWKFDTNKYKVPAGYPRQIADWNNIPESVDAAFTWDNGKTYFFKNGQYWRYDPEELAGSSNPPFPRDAGHWWFGCSIVRNRRFRSQKDQRIQRENDFQGPS